MTKPDKPISPQLIPHFSDITHGDVYCRGLTMREHFAALALQGLLARKDVGLSLATDGAVLAADLLIKKLNREVMAPENELRTESRLAGE